MRIHHLNGGCMCPFGGRMFDGRSQGLLAHLVCHCLLLETNRGLVLVDTGFGLRDMHQPETRLSRFFTAFNNIRFDARFTASHQVQALGFKARDVRHILLTHLDFDHAGGVEDFPEATMHVMQSEWDAMAARRGFIGQRRWRPAQWDAVRRWRFYQPGGNRWFGFDAVRDLVGLPPEILMIPLNGHTPGHAGIAIRSGQGWLLHAGDAYFHRGEIAEPERRCPPGLRFYQWMMEVDRPARLANQQRLRALMQDGTAHTEILCSHDSGEWAMFRASSLSPNEQSPPPPLAMAS